jgi:hypothetical protein
VFKIGKGGEAQATGGVNADMNCFVKLYGMRIFIIE